MPTKPYIKYHADGSVWAKGQTLNGQMIGKWTFFRKDGSKMRTGHFQKGKQSGEWVTYSKDGRKVKVTMMKDR